MDRKAEMIWTDVTAIGWAKIKKESEKALKAAIKSGDGAINIGLKSNGKISAKFVKNPRREGRKG